MQNGARSWFRLGSVSLQPAELAKIGFIIVFSKVLSNTGSSLNKPKTLGKVLALPAVLCVLMPVSYTHLDVYKRQVYELSKSIL